MKVLIFSDVHGNLPAFEKMLESAGRVDQYICLGDVIGYGPWGNDCVDLIRTLKNCIYLEGNHERDHLNGRYSGSNGTAKIFFDFTYPTFKRYSGIENLRSEYFAYDYIFAHTINSKNIYADSEIYLENNYMVGHSHHQFKIEQRGFVLYNTGSVGQNREFINIINYLVLDTETGKVEMISCRYDEQKVIEAMRRLNYPSICVDYYLNKPKKNE
jgi:predicted phosphodiesterase